MESTFQKIIRKTGMKQSFCKCNLCKKQCSTPCLATPEDIKKLIDAGYADRLAETDWYVGKLMGVIDKPIPMIQPLFDDSKGSCTFFTDGLCELHDKGLKPTEGKLSHHSTNGFKNKREIVKKSIAFAVAREWIE